MYQLKRRGPIGYEDLLREMESIEHQLLSENSSLAMNLMVLEARIRERFQVLDAQARGQFISETTPVEETSYLDEIRALIPKDMPYLPSLEQADIYRRRKKTLETMGMAALLALGTALGVFGLASILQLVLAWAA
ncbi:MAG: hypothetical protein KCHDKBKB_02403 [Elusimicrobia bacterium]|nr:hypothetical protein [Elusimicrobiota bacterium]